MDKTKKCNKCKCVKNLDNFYRNKSRKDGHDTWCKECSNEYSKKYYNKNSDKIKRRIKQWNEKIKTNSIYSYIKRYLTKRKAVINASVEDIIGLYNKNPNCYYCGKSLDYTEISFDHKIPLSRNGTKTIDNIALSCKNCNFFKHTMTDIEFISFLKEFRKQLNNHFSNTMIDD